MAVFLLTGCGVTGSVVLSVCPGFVVLVNGLVGASFEANFLGGPLVGGV